MIHVEGKLKAELEPNRMSTECSCGQSLTKWNTNGEVSLILGEYSPTPTLASR